MAPPEKKRQKDFLLKRQAKDYASNATIHGLGYLAENKRPASEGSEEFLLSITFTVTSISTLPTNLPFSVLRSLCWLVLIILSISLGVYLITPIYTKWRNSPTYTSIKTTNFPVWDIPFPGVTICSNIVVNDLQLKKALSTEL